jgi:hypothetical protein
LQIAKATKIFAKATKIFLGGTSENGQSDKFLRTKRYSRGFENRVPRGSIRTQGRPFGDVGFQANRAAAPHSLKAWSRGKKKKPLFSVSFLEKHLRYTNVNV